MAPRTCMTSAHLGGSSDLCAPDAQICESTKAPPFFTNNTEKNPRYIHPTPQSSRAAPPTTGMSPHSVNRNKRTHNYLGWCNRRGKDTMIPGYTARYSLRATLRVGCLMTSISPGLDQMRKTHIWFPRRRVRTKEESRRLPRKPSQK